jgi:nitrous oxide reductase accessory protein NosL
LSERVWLFAGIACLGLILPARALTGTIPVPGPRDLCPVCGMVVSKYPNWIAMVRYRDGHAHYFDGAKDMFKYLFNLSRYAPGHRSQDIEQIVVTEYYDLKRLDARRAFFVIGSDMHGPMGHELIPLATRADAEEFLRDHGGRRILTYMEVTPGMPAELDAGRFGTP